MALKVSVGLSKKVGLPDYGSLGASCNVEVELDGTLLQHDVEKFHQHVRRAYQACAQAVNEELSRSNGHSAPPANGQSTNGANGNGHAKANGNGNGKTNGQRQATQSQVKAILSIARNQRLNLGVFLKERFGVDRPEELDIKTASQVIDTLKAGAEGRPG